MSPNERVTWSVSAEADLIKIWRYFARVASEQIADRLIIEIADASNRLEQNPLMGRARNEFGDDARSILVQPYTIFYRTQSGQIQIIRVLHERQDTVAINDHRPAL
jgi:plasmid stabilization system protein ParE